MSVFAQGIHNLFYVEPGNSTVRVTGLKSGTLYCVLAQGSFGIRTTGIIGAVSSGTGYSLIGPLPASATTLQSQIVTETGITAPDSYFVAGAGATLFRYTVQIEVDPVASSPTNIVVNAAAPDFNEGAVDSNIESIICHISRDNGKTFNEVQTVSTPFTNFNLFATFSIPIPYGTDVQMYFLVQFKDSTYGPQSSIYHVHGTMVPSSPVLAAPSIGSMVGQYMYADGNISLTFSAVVTADPIASNIQVQMFNGANPVFSTTVPNIPGQAVTCSIPNISSAVPTYTIKAASILAGSASPNATTTWNSNTSLPYVPPAFAPLSSIFLSEYISNPGGSLQSQIHVYFNSLLNPAEPQGAVYYRLQDSTPMASLTLANFTLASISPTGDVYTPVLTTVGAGVSYEVVVLSVSPSGIQAAFTTNQIQSVPITQNAEYVPTEQPQPVITVLSPKSIMLTGTYNRPAFTPAPVEIRAYNNESSTAGAGLVLKGTYSASAMGVCSYSLTIPDITQFSIGGGQYAITLRSYLENNGITPTQSKTSVLITILEPPAPTWQVAPTAVVSTFGGTVGGVNPQLVSPQDNVTIPATSAGGNWASVTVTLQANALQVEVADATADPGPTGTGTNALDYTPSAVYNGTWAYITLSPTNNTGAKNVRTRWLTAYGNSNWSPAAEIIFPYIPTVVTTSNITGCTPEWTSNPDGTITLQWLAGNFGSATPGTYVIWRNVQGSNNQLTASSIGTTTGLTFTDYLQPNMQEKSYYYWLGASNSQGFQANSPAAVVSSTDGVTTLAPSHRSIVPSTPVGLGITGATGGFTIAWNPNPELNIKSYTLEWSALGDFSDTVSFVITGTSYFQTQGATAPLATALIYAWKLVANDTAGNSSAALGPLGMINSANYGTLQGSAPTAPTGVSQVANTDGSITVSLPVTTAAYFHICRMSKSTPWTPATADPETGAPSDGSTMESQAIIAGTSPTFVDTGLNTNKFYTYRVYTRSQLGTDSATYAAPPSPVQPSFVVPGTQRQSLIINGQFGNASGAFGTSFSGWTLGTNVNFTAAASNYAYDGYTYQTPGFTTTAVESAVVLSQNFQVVPGAKYSVMGIVNYAPATQNGNAYIRVSPAASLLNSSNGAAIYPAPYSAAGGEASGTDKTTVDNTYRVITFSFIAPAATSQMSLNVGFENKTTFDSVTLYPMFIQVYADQ